MGPLSKFMSFFPKLEWFIFQVDTPFIDVFFKPFISLEFSSDVIAIVTVI